MSQRTVATNPFDGQRPGNLGLRKQRRSLPEPHYIEDFFHSVREGQPPCAGKKLVLGGAGRLYTREATRRVLRGAAGKGFTRLVVGQAGLSCPRPRVSHLVRNRGTSCGVILSASRNPGGMDGDFGIKYHITSGGPAEAVTEAAYAPSFRVDPNKAFNGPDINLDRRATPRLGPTDDQDRRFHLGSYAISAVTGPYATAIIEGLQSAPRGSVINETPARLRRVLSRPELSSCPTLLDAAMGANGPDCCATSEGERNLVVARSMNVAPSDSLPILGPMRTLHPGPAAVSQASHGRSRPGGPPTASHPSAAGACSRCQTAGDSRRPFDAGSLAICGEESAGTSSSHVHEKTACGRSAVPHQAGRAASKHCRDRAPSQFGRDSARVTTTKADLLQNLRERLSALRGKQFGSRFVASADDFAHQGPTDGSVSRNQGIRGNTSRHSQPKWHATTHGLNAQSPTLPRSRPRLPRTSATLARRAEPGFAGGHEGARRTRYNSVWKSNVARFRA